MIVYQLISIEILVGVIVIGVIASRKKSIAERVVSLIAAPVSFLISFVLSKLINIGLFGDALDKLISSINGGAVVTEETYPTLYGVSKAAAISIGKHILLVLVFWIILGILSTVVHFVFRSREGEETTGGKCVASCAIGGFKYFVVLMLSLLPVVALINIVYPIKEYAETSKAKDTYVYDVGDYSSQNYIVPIENSVLMKVNKYCGAGALLGSISDSLSTQNIKLPDGTVEKVNVNKFLKQLESDGMPIGSAYEYFRDPSSHTLGDIAELPPALKDIASDKVTSCFVAELIAASGESNIDDPIISKLIEALKSGDPESYSKTFETVGKLLEVLAEKYPEVSLDSDEVVSSLVSAMKDKDFSNKVSEILASSDVGADIAYEITSKALDSMYDAMGLDEGKISGLNFNMEMFKQLFGEENVAKYAEILIKLSELIDELGGFGNITPEKVISKFDKVGALFDAMAEFEGSPELPTEALMTISTDASYAKYFTFLGAGEIISRFNNKTATFEESFAIIRDHYTSGK